MAFVPEANEWLRAHLEDIPQETMKFIGSLKELEILDVGCGDMLADFGMIARGPKHVTGLDLPVHPWDVVERTAAEIRSAGLNIRSDYKSRLTYITYDGITFPFDDGTFDFVYSWSAFEHIGDVPRVLREIRRVVRREGRVFLQVYPWYPSFWGSHLTDYIEEPFFQVKRPNEWVHEQLIRYAKKNPSNADFVLGHMWQEYQTLNKLSARTFLSAVANEGFCIERLQTIVRMEHLDALPPVVPIVDAISAGTMVLLYPAK